jgi:hypothetical protein
LYYRIVSHDTPGATAGMLKIREEEASSRMKPKPTD